MMNTNETLWKFQHEDETLCYGNPTDARGLEIRKQCGYTWVCMGSVGWLQIQVAQRKLALAERLSALAAAV